MTAAILTFSALFSIGALIIGFISGWVGNEYYTQYVEAISTPKLHPEMYDSYGNLIDTNLVAFKFTEGLEEYEEYDED